MEVASVGMAVKEWLEELVEQAIQEVAADAARRRRRLSTLRRPLSCLARQLRRGEKGEGGPLAHMHLSCRPPKAAISNAHCRARAGFATGPLCK